MKINVWGFCSIFLLGAFSLVVESCQFNTASSPEMHSNVLSSPAIDLTRLKNQHPRNASEYLHTLNLLDDGNLSSLEVAAHLYQNGPADSLVRDSMFQYYDDFLRRLADGYFENNEELSGQLEKTPSAKFLAQLKVQFAQSGLRFKGVKGNFVLEPDHRYLLQQFGSSLSKGYAQYLALLGQQQEVEGDSLASPTLESLAGQVIGWEDFIVRFPNFIGQHGAREHYVERLVAFLASREHPAVFDPEMRILKDSSRVVMEDFIRVHPASKSAEWVSNYLDMLKKEHYRYSERVDSFLLERVTNDNFK